MIYRSSRYASGVAMAAALSMIATPAAALDIPAAGAPAQVHTAKVDTGAPAEANQWRRYRGHRHRDRGIDAGDVVAGVVVLGALAAIIGSANSNRDRDRYEPRRQDIRYDRDRDYDSRGIEGAVDMCVDEVEYRDSRVESVDRADRSASGWNVEGVLDNGERWTCFIDNGGQIRSIDYGSVAYSQTPAAAAAAGDQWDDADYARARASTRTAADEGYSYDDEPLADVPAADGPRPAYPGGPLPGEEGYGEDWQSEAEPDESWEGDGRYTTAQTPDFQQPAR
ncbi:hypothetical protein [Aurantiacibacter hainanensis]|uniref:hypothetical protein n=1 Tax=Aurantiacibacter hainanensis TaxID=3076114 RepID=UPI0030C71DEF